MAVTIEDIKKLRAMTGAGMKDCKKALAEADGDINKAVELVRERGLAIAAKRSDRTTSNGCVLVKNVNGFAAMIALKCETDFVSDSGDPRRCHRCQGSYPRRGERAEDQRRSDRG